LINVQKSFNDNKKLYIVTTPIGNLNDITIRALDTLRSVELILCEDTRVSSKLLNYYEIKKPLLSYYDYNSDHRITQMDELFTKYNSIALISDAGTPLINDPGYDLVNYCIDHQINVISIPGVTSIISALTSSGLATNSFIFSGFVSQQQSKLISFLDSIKKYEGTLIFLESPHRILSSLKLLYDYLGDTAVVLSRELTKLHETIYRGSLLDALTFDFDDKGEYVILLKHTAAKLELDPLKYHQELVKSGIASMEAIKIVAKELGISKNTIYKLIKC
jgi:16S rRNA (cytidine1402-2'-O)-methyltransferase